MLTLRSKWFHRLMISIFIVQAAHADPPPQPRGHRHSTTIEADIIDCQSQSGRCKAVGHAVLTHGQTVVRGNTILATQSQTVSQKLMSFDAIDVTGNVTINSVFGHASCPLASYVLASETLSLKGPKTLFFARDGFISTDHSLHYDQKKRTLTSNGPSLLRHKDTVVQSNQLKVFLDDHHRIQKAQAHGDVVLTSPQETVQADMIDYDATTHYVNMAPRRQNHEPALSRVKIILNRPILKKP